jgi:hypothetical protein
MPDAAFGGSRGLQTPESEAKMRPSSGAGTVSATSTRRLFLEENAAQQLRLLSTATGEMP